MAQKHYSAIIKLAVDGKDAMSAWGPNILLVLLYRIFDGSMQSFKTSQHSRQAESQYPVWVVCTVIALCSQRP